MGVGGVVWDGMGWRLAGQDVSATALPVHVFCWSIQRSCYWCCRHFVAGAGTAITVLAAANAAAAATAVLTGVLSHNANLVKVYFVHVFYRCSALSPHTAVPV